MKKKLEKDIESDPDREFVEVTDNDSHHYVIPLNRRNEWYQFLEIPENDETSWDVPDWAQRIDGGRVIFKSWRLG